MSERAELEQRKAELERELAEVRRALAGRAEQVEAATRALRERRDALIREVKAAESEAEDAASELSLLREVLAEAQREERGARKHLRELKAR